MIRSSLAPPARRRLALVAIAAVGGSIAAGPGVAHGDAKREDPGDKQYAIPLEVARGLGKSGGVGRSGGVDLGRAREYTFRSSPATLGSVPVLGLRGINSPLPGVTTRTALPIAASVAAGAAGGGQDDEQSTKSVAKRSQAITAKAAHLPAPPVDPPSATRSAAPVWAGVGVLGALGGLGVLGMRLFRRMRSSD